MLHNPLEATNGAGDVSVVVNTPATSSSAGSDKELPRPRKKKRRVKKDREPTDKREEDGARSTQAEPVQVQKGKDGKESMESSADRPLEVTDGIGEEEKPAPPTKILVLDIGGTKLKALASGQTEPRKMTSGKRLTPAKMVKAVQELAVGWEYEAVSIGFPGLVGENGPRSEPGNLSSGWVGFDYTAAFGMPVRIINDASMQALGSYEGGRMLFLGLGTGLGSALIANNVLINLELGQLPYREGRNLGETLGRRGMTQLGKKEWRTVVGEIVPALMGAFAADYVVLGGGNSKEVKVLPPGARMGHNLTAFRGGFRVWHVDDVRTQSGDVSLPGASAASGEWRLV